jgi:hypothetical protein
VGNGGRPMLFTAETVKSRPAASGRGSNCRLPRRAGKVLLVSSLPAAGAGACAELAGQAANPSLNTKRLVVFSTQQAAVGGDWVSRT